MTKWLKLLSVLMAMCLTLAIGGQGLADEATDPEGASGNVAAYEEPGEIDREAMLSVVVGDWGSDEATTYQFQETLAHLSDGELEAVLNAVSIDGINTILAGDATPQVVGDAGSDYSFTPVTPCRIVDTRNAGGMFAAGTSRAYYVYGTTQISAQGGNPAGCTSPVGEPRGVVVNVTAVSTANGNLRAYPANVAVPNASLVNFRPGVPIANAAAVKTYYSFGPEELKIYASAATHVVIDVMGYYSAPVIPAGIEFVGGDQQVNLSPTDTSVRAISVSVPGGRYCTINASGYFYLSADNYARCSITTGTAVEFSYLALGSNYSNSTDINYVPFSATRTYYQAAGTTTYRLVCDSLSATTARVDDVNMAAVCIPNRY
ncbi:MAG: hypothetical protein SCH71_10185 [Desulfobulbaceae bacterium]|nr:hypothetical protein [Desulfobulbaceae bacterium]